MTRLAVLIVLISAFAPAAVMGALPVVAPVVVVLLGLTLALYAYEYEPTPVVAVTERSASRG